MVRSVRGMIGLLAFAGIWETASRTGILDPLYAPPASQVCVGVIRLLLSAEFRQELAVTLAVWGLAVGVAVGVAVPFGLLLGAVPFVRGAVGPLLEWARAVPAVAVLPLVSVTLGSGPLAQLLLGAVAAGWPILISTTYAGRTIEQGYLEAAKACGAGRVRRTLWVRLPASGPAALSGLRVGAAVALIVVVSVGLLSGVGTLTGLGGYVAFYGVQRADPVTVLAAAVITGLLGLGAHVALTAMSRTRWTGWPTGPGTA